ncbi:MAG: endolytic transglycosylase MltG, partial [Elusimicrobia bacterium CG08_land_8_20_14_0_20_51_18]
MKKFFILLVIFFPLFAAYLFYPGETVKISVEEGRTATQIARQLKDSGIIWSSLWFRALVKFTGAGKKIMPGEYELKKRSTHEAVLWKLTHSVYISSVKIVIPEGWRAEQIAERLKSNGVISDETSFLDLVKEKKLEGYLFPSTYHLKKNMKPEEVTDILTGEYERNIKPLFSGRTALMGLEEYKILIVASIVEREAVIDTERPLIAAVYLNRIKKRMPLEADPTVQYALGYWKKNLSYKDLKFPSPYNTYYVNSIPPGPICNPGVESVRASLAPAEIDALYFVADRKGRHVF